jgi:release factor glutamine methyltransferase
MSEEENNTIANLLNLGRQKLRSISCTPQLDAEIFLSAATGISRENLIINLNNKVTFDIQKKIESFLYQRLKGYSVAQIIAKKYFWKSDFIVTKDTFAPRPETETIISSILSEYKNKKEQIKIAEFGTGTGCIIISLTNEYKNATSYGFEKNFNTYLVTKKNVNAHNLQNKIKIFYKDFKVANRILNNIDIIVSNPPYIRKFEIKNLQKEIQYEPRIALDGGFNGILPYLDIFKVSTKILKRNGQIFLEIGDDQHKEITQIVKFFPFKLSNKFKDLSGKIRVLSFKKD